MSTPGPSDRPAPPTRCPRPPGDQRFPLRDHPRPAAPASYVRTSVHPDLGTGTGRVLLCPPDEQSGARRDGAALCRAPGPRAPEPRAPNPPNRHAYRRRSRVEHPVLVQQFGPGIDVGTTLASPRPALGGDSRSPRRPPPGDFGEQDRPLRAFVAQAPRTRGPPRPRTPATSARRTALPQRRKARPRGAGPPCAAGLLASASGRRALGPGFPGVGAGTGPRKPGPGPRRPGVGPGPFRCVPVRSAASGRRAVSGPEVPGLRIVLRPGRRVVVRTSGRPGSWFRCDTRSRYPRLRSGLRCGASGFADAGSACGPPGAAPGKRCAGRVGKGQAALAAERRTSPGPRE